VHVLLYTADSLSHLLSPQICLSIDKLDDSISTTEEFVSSVVAGLQASLSKLDAYHQAKKEDPTCQQIVKFPSTGWPKKRILNFELRA